MEDLGPRYAWLEESPKCPIDAEDFVAQYAVEEDAQHSTTTADERGVLLRFRGVAAGDGVGGKGVLGWERRDDVAGVEGTEGLAEGVEVRVPSAGFLVLWERA